MNRTFVAALALVAASSAFAESPLVGATSFTGAKSRGEVQAELQQYKASGVNPWSQGYNPLRGFTSSTTRVQVTSAYLQSRDQTAALTGEDSGSGYLTVRTAGAAAPIVAGQLVNAL